MDLSKHFAQLTLSVVNYMIPLHYILGPTPGKISMFPSENYDGSKPNDHLFLSLLVGFRFFF